MSLTDTEREALALLLGAITLAPGIWAAPGHMDKINAAVEQIAQARATAAVEAFRARAVEAIRANHEAERGNTFRIPEATAWSAYDHALRIVRDLT